MKKQMISLFCLVAVCVMVTACGVKPKTLDTPAEGNSTYPQVYPAKTAK
tara:strand:- start:729 stop:875 length:147 start_codon:yes stop_codon:yes gene_type:complete